MRKSYLLLLAIIPLFGSCNKNSGFPNPFPNDNYNKIGFKINETNDAKTNEKINRTLTNDEEKLVLSTIKDKDSIDQKIYTMSAEKHTREYTRAFAGEFKDGYDVKNLMRDETITSIKQDEGEETGEEGSKKLEPTARARTKTHNIYTTTSQYSYGQIEEKVEQNDFIYFKKRDGEKYTESIKSDDEISVYHRLQKIENTTYKTYDDQVVEETAEKAKSAKYFNITQSQYITAPDSKSGVTNDGQIVLVTATQVKHNHEDPEKAGFFYLKDGRKYQAIDNNLTVTKLTPSKDKTWYLASYVRTYSETVITSEVIQPNVQVTKLKTPITISYTEEIASFSEAKSPIDNELPKEGK